MKVTLFKIPNSAYKICHKYTTQFEMCASLIFIGRIWSVGEYWSSTCVLSPCLLFSFWPYFLLTLISRAIFRLVLLLWYKSGIQTSPPIIPLDRGEEFIEGQFSVSPWLLSLSSKEQHRLIEKLYCLLNKGNVIYLLYVICHFYYFFGFTKTAKDKRMFPKIKVN